jgi:hypothetical protein
VFCRFHVNETSAVLCEWHFNQPEPVSFIDEVIE